MGALVELVVGNRPGLEWVLRIQNPNMLSPFEVACPARDQALDWMAAIKETVKNASVRVSTKSQQVAVLNRALCLVIIFNINIFIKESQTKEKERAWRIAKEMSSLIVYCRSVAFNLERLKRHGFIYAEMSSFAENKAERLICKEEPKFFLQYHQVNDMLQSLNTIETTKNSDYYYCFSISSAEYTPKVKE